MSKEQDKNVPEDSVDNDAVNEDAVESDSVDETSDSTDTATPDGETSDTDEVELDRNGEPLSEKAKARRAAREKAAAEQQKKSGRRNKAASRTGRTRSAAAKQDEDAGAATAATVADREDEEELTPREPAAHNGLAHKLYSGEISYDFVGKRKKFFIVSAIIVVICIAFLGIKQLNLGIEFKGGADFQAPTQVTSQTIPEVTQAVQDSGVGDLDEMTVSTIGDGTVRVQTRSLNTQEVQAVRGAIAKQVGTDPERVAYSLIGASWGQQITTKGAIALVVFLVLVMAMIWIYFRDLKMSVAAIVALLHDLVLTVGVYAIVGFTVTPATLIGLLTILGYSLYDTVVVFDKVRENVTDLRRRTYGEAANLAINQVLVRSINTTVIGVLPVAALLAAGWFILGTGPLKDLGLALFVGMIAGAYSSIFIAAPLLVAMKNREPAMIAHDKALLRRRSGDDGAESDSEDDESTGGSGSLPGQFAVTVGSASQPPARGKK